MPKNLYKLLKRKYEPNKYILFPKAKIGIKTGQPCRLDSIVPAGAKKYKKTLAFKLTFQIF